MAKGSLGEVYMAVACPKCGSEKIEPLKYGCRIGAGIGLLVGGYYGYSGGVSDDLLSTSSGQKMPLSLSLHSVVSGLQSAVGPQGTKLTVAAAGGCAAGAYLGSQLDKHVLNNRRCNSCEHAWAHDQ